LQQGISATFLERRFRMDGSFDAQRLARLNVLAFLAPATHVDEFYRISEKQADLGAGLYRIRQSGPGTILLTLKHNGSLSNVASETIDHINPSEELLSAIRKNGELVAVVEKDRLSYKSMNHQQCFLHVDSVQGIGDFLDVKADHPRELEGFLKELGLSKVPAIGQQYVDLRIEQGISPLQLRMWKFQRIFSDYILGVVSGTLTPLGLLTVTATMGGSQTAQMISLLSVGLCDGLADATAAGQATQSHSRASVFEQVSMFFKTMAGKVAIPITFIPVVLLTEGPVQTCAAATCWGTALLATTASIQALAHGKNVVREVARSVAFGLGSVALGFSLAQVLPPTLEWLLGN
jgi:adenylate cyclase class IV